MAAINPSAVDSDAVYLQQIRKGGQMLALDVTTSGLATDTWTAPASIGPFAVAWVPNTTSDACAVRISGTKVVTFATNTAVVNGKLLLFYGGAS